MNITTVKELSKAAREKSLATCLNCSRNHEKEFPVYAFGCEKHQQSNSPLILYIFRDPSSPQKKGIIGCAQDGHVCPWCHNDQSANNFREFYDLMTKECWELEVDSTGKYPVYFINSVLHGAERNTKPKIQEIRSCAEVVKQTIQILKPKLVVGLGLDAIRSLEISYDFKNLRSASEPINKDGTHIWWSFHTSPLALATKEEEVLTRFFEIGKWISTNTPKGARLVKGHTPRHFRVFIGGFWGNNYTITWKRDRLIVDLFNAHSKSKQNEIIPTSKAWDKFWDSINNIGVWEWSEHYDSDILDGTQWNVELWHGNKRVKSYGNNSYPPNGTILNMSTEFKNFSKAIKDLTGEIDILSDQSN